MAEAGEEFAARAVRLNYTNPGNPQPPFNAALYDMAAAEQAKKILAWLQPVSAPS